MNNSVDFSIPEEKPDKSERAGKLTTLIEAAHAILDSKEWSTLKESEFDAELARLKRLLFAEAKKRPVSESELYYLQGRIEAMERFDLGTMASKWHAELQTIKKLN